MRKTWAGFNNQIKRKIRELKEQELKEQDKYREIEMSQAKYDTLSIHKKVREITEKFKRNIK